MNKYENNPHDAEYARVTKQILDQGEVRPNRTGVGTIAIPAAMMQFDLSRGFPLLTLKQTFWKSMAVELEGFIHGITDKSWYQARGCRIWDQWCNPITADNNDLGPIYGSQWRSFGGWRDGCGHDQLRTVLTSLEKTPDNRRMVVSAWNPDEQPYMALPPCHVVWQVLVVNGALHLNWYQRSCDWFLGIPFNVASYSLLAHLLANQFGFTPGKVTGFFGDSHLYENQVDLAREMLERDSFPPPTIDIPHGIEILSWTHQQLKFENYQHNPAIRVPVVV